MRLKGKIIAVFLILLVSGILYWVFWPEPYDVLFNENFEKNTGTFELIRLDDSAVNHTHPYSTNIEPKEGDFMLSLFTGDKGHTGGGEWSLPLDIEIEESSLSDWKVTKLSWYWNGYDMGRYQLWIAISFNNHRPIFYVAEGGMNPGYYEDGINYTAITGEWYRDENNRTWHFERGAIILGIEFIPGTWVRVERNIEKDFKKFLGDVSQEVRITGIKIGMVDDDSNHYNELAVDDIALWG